MDQRPQLKYFVKWKNVPTVLQHFRFYVPWRSHVITFTKCDPSLPSSPMIASSRSVPLCQEYNPRFPFAVSIMQDLQSVSGSTHQNGHGCPSNKLLGGWQGNKMLQFEEGRPCREQVSFTESKFPRMTLPRTARHPPAFFWDLKSQNGLPIILKHDFWWYNNPLKNWTRVISITQNGLNPSIPLVTCSFQRRLQKNWALWATAFIWKWNPAYWHTGHTKTCRYTKVMLLFGPILLRRTWVLYSIGSIITIIYPKETQVFTHSDSPPRRNSNLRFGST